MAAREDLPLPQVPGTAPRSPQETASPVNPAAGPRLGFPSWWPNPWIVRGWFYRHGEAFRNSFTEPCRPVISRSLIENSLPTPPPAGQALEQGGGLGAPRSLRGASGASHMLEWGLPGIRQTGGGDTARLTPAHEGPGQDSELSVPCPAPGPPPQPTPPGHTVSRLPIRARDLCRAHPPAEELASPSPGPTDPWAPTLHSRMWVSHSSSHFLILRVSSSVQQATGLRE